MWSHGQRISNASSASKRRGNNLKGFRVFCPEQKARMWPRLPYVFQLQSTAVSDSGLRPQERVCPEVLRCITTQDPRTPQGKSASPDSCGNPVAERASLYRIADGSTLWNAGSGSWLIVGRFHSHHRCQARGEQLKRFRDV